MQTMTVTLSADEWSLVKQILREETDLTNKMRTEIKYILKGINAAPVSKKEMTMKTEAMAKLLDKFDRVVKEFNLEDYHDEWLVEFVDAVRVTAHAELATLKESEKRAIRLCETIWHRQWSNPEDCLTDAIDLMKAINPDHPMVKARTLREEIAAKKDSYIALRKANEGLREGLDLIAGQVAHIGGNLGEAYGIKRCAEIAESYLEGGGDSDE